MKKATVAVILIVAVSILAGQAALAVGDGDTVPDPKIRSSYACCSTRRSKPSRSITAGCVNSGGRSC